MDPAKSYKIWFSQRCGSSLLCQALESTGIAGKPGEHFFGIYKGTLCDHYGVDNYQDLKKALWNAGTLNGIFAVKNSFHQYHYYRIFNEILQLRDIHPTAELDHESIWADLFPNCKYIFLTRRNKVRLAVSWWKAIKDQVWHLKGGEEHQNPGSFYQEHYDFDALIHLLKEAVLRECAMQEYFNRYQIQPFTVVYEDFVNDYEGTIRKVIDFLEIEYDSLEIAPPYYHKTADAGSEEWVQRFRLDLQNQEEAELIW